MAIQNSTNNKYSFGNVANRLEGAAEAPFRAVGAIVGKAPRLTVEAAAIGGGYLAADWGVDHIGKLNSGEISFGPNAAADPALHYAAGAGAIVGGGLLITAGAVSGLNTAYQAVKGEFKANS
ncbi:MAG: hypothetical protein RMA76_01040 [Deltaproteobacteria bacterium]|jgi:hypothetical protein